MTEDDHPPKDTPWGETNREWEPAFGFVFVGTPHHGGLYLTPEQSTTIPEYLKAHSADKNGQWWEKDCAWSLPIVYLLSQRPRDSLSDGEEFLLRRAHDFARDRFPDEWQKITGLTLSPGKIFQHHAQLEKPTHPDDNPETAPQPFKYANITDADREAAAAVFDRWDSLVVDEFHDREFDGGEHSGPHYAKLRDEFLATTAAEKTITPQRLSNVIFMLMIEGEDPRNSPQLSNRYRITYHTGTKIQTLRKDGQLHADDRPARIVTSLDGLSSIEYYRNDKLHRDDGPALIEYDSDGIRLEQWHRDGNLHREDGPARIKRNSDGVRTEQEYYRNGQLHRDNGPARKVDNPREQTEEHWHEGQRHREDGPAVIVRLPDGTVYERCYRYGQLHRDDGPANVEYDSDLGLRSEEWHRNGKIHREDGPAKIWRFSNGTHIQTYYQNNQPHRDDGPARIIENPDGTHVEEWFRRGQRHRDNGPAWTTYYPNGPRTEQYYHDDQLHRQDGPASIKTDTDGTTTQEWYSHGKLHRLDGPSFLRKFPDGRALEQWHRDGNLHREDGPAQIHYRADGSIEKQLFFHQGDQLDHDPHSQNSNHQPTKQTAQPTAQERYTALIEQQKFPDLTKPSTTPNRSKEPDRER